MCLGKAGPACVALTAACDGVLDCVDGSDEAFCNMYKRHDGDTSCGDSAHALETFPAGPVILGAHGGTCNECTPGTFSDVQHSFAECQECPSGTYEENTGSTECTRCPRGLSTTVTKSTSISACTPCSIGTVQLVDGGKCLPCNPGTYNPNRSSFGAITSVCRLCDPNTIQPAPGRASCINCRPGAFQPRKGQTSCMTCHPSCSECSISPGNCHACKPPFFLKGSNCVDRAECGGKEYEDHKARQCRDHSAPTFLRCPKDQKRYAWGHQNGTVVDWATVEAVDDVDNNVTVAVSTKPGWFLVGKHTVTAEAMDSSNNTGSCQFVIEVVRGNRSTCVDPATRRRRAEETRLRHRFQADVDYVDPTSNKRFRLKSHGEFAHGLVTLVNQPFIAGVECTQTDLVLTLANNAPVEDQEAVLQKWTADKILAVEGVWGCLDETGKVGPVYRRIAANGVIALSTHPLIVRVQTTNATFVDCFRHANVDFDYHPGNATIQLNAEAEDAGDDAGMDFEEGGNNSAITPKAVLVERRRLHRQRRAWGLPWTRDDGCFLGLCTQLGESKPLP